VTSESTRPVVLAIQNDPTTPAALVGEWLEEDGLRVDVVGACFGDVVPTEVPAGVHAVLSLGGAMGANDDDIAPWLVDERSLLADAVARDIPVLGLCLGGQLLAKATGGVVELGPVTEIGVTLVQRTVDGLLDEITSQAIPVRGGDIPAPQWHQDHITTLPDAAVLLMTNDACRVQAFRLGDTAYGLQMHPEVTPEIFASWADVADEALERSGRDAREASAEVSAAEPDVIAAWRPVTRAWGELVWKRSGISVPSSP